MTTYNPDSWVVVEIEFPDGKKLQKTVAGWTGSYAEPDYWKLNSGNVSVTVEGSLIKIKGISGSEYLVTKGGYRISNIMQVPMNIFVKGKEQGVIKSYRILELAEVINAAFQ